jgi:hypothetical protein
MKTQVFKILTDASTRKTKNKYQDRITVKQFKRKRKPLKTNCM